MCDNYLSITNFSDLLMTVFCDRYDTGRDKFIDFEELKHMMEKLGVPQTHLCLKAMIKEVDEDFDGKISFREVFNFKVYYLL
jgi:Ca2+-binding EF-hand superfamily protein